MAQYSSTARRTVSLSSRENFPTSRGTASPNPFLLHLFSVDDGTRYASDITMMARHATAYPETRLVVKATPGCLVDPEQRGLCKQNATQLSRWRSHSSRSWWSTLWCFFRVVQSHLGRIGVRKKGEQRKTPTKRHVERRNDLCGKMTSVWPLAVLALAPRVTKMVKQSLAMALLTPLTS